MIVRIEAHFEEEERDGWLCAKLTGTYTVIRIDSSKCDVDRDGLIKLLKSEPLALSGDACPNCRSESSAFQEDANGLNRMCHAGCGPFHFNEPTDQQD